MQNASFWISFLDFVKHFYLNKIQHFYLAESFYFFIFLHLLANYFMNQLKDFIQIYSSLAFGVSPTWLPDRASVSQRKNDHNTVSFTNTELRFDVVIAEGHPQNLIFVLTNGEIFRFFIKLWIKVFSRFDQKRLKRRFWRLSEFKTCFFKECKVI